MNVHLPDTIHGIQAPPSRNGAADLYELSLERAELRDEQDALRHDGQVSVSFEGLEARVRSCVAHLQTLTEAAKDLVCQSKPAQNKLIQACKAVQLKRSEVRRPVSPDRTMTCSVAAITTSIEGCMTCLVLFSGGAPIGEAVGFGMLFASVGTALAHILGFYGLRRVNYRLLPELDAQLDEPRNLRKKGRRAVVVCGALIGLLVFTAARLRATGGLEDTFNFSEIGLLATFSDGMAIALIAMAFVTTFLNTWQGLTGWGDRSLGFAEPFEELAENEEVCLAQTDALRDQVSDVSEMAIDAFLDRQGIYQDCIDNPPETAERLMSEIRQFNAGVHAALEDELRFQYIQNELRSLEGSAKALTTDIENAFNALLLSEEYMEIGESAVEQARISVVAIDDLISRVEAAEAEAIAKIELAAAGYSANGAVLGSHVMP